MNRQLRLIPFSILMGIAMTGCNSITSQTPNNQPSSAANSISLKGKSLIGALLNATDEQGRLHTFKIADVEHDPDDRDLYLYTVLY